MDLGLTNKVIIVTGGGGKTGSIGEVTVRRIAAEGGIPVIVDKHPRGKKLQEELTGLGKEAYFIQADLTDPEACQKTARQTVEKYGRIEGLVNNLGINDGIGFDNSYSEFMDSIKLNLAHFFVITKAALPHLKKSSGPIINIASKVAVTGQGGTSGYAAAKGGVLALTREWALDLREHNIRVNALVIAESYTPAYKKWLQQFDQPEEVKKSVELKVPLGRRMTQPEEIADSILFLLSDRSSHTTGQICHVDGGYVHLDRAIT
ncbi:MAG TPA: SDR family oxidoreductase [Fodinibius sp.]|nr:SDR family oxidoreductase [Fodinibius sp.]